MLRAECRDLFSFMVHDNARHVGRFLSRRTTFQVDAIGQARDQVAAFRIDREIQRLQKDGNGLRGSLHGAAVLNDHCNRAFAP